MPALRPTPAEAGEVNCSNAKVLKILRHRRPRSLHAWLSRWSPNISQAKPIPRSKIIDVLPGHAEERAVTGQGWSGFAGRTRSLMACLAFIAGIGDEFISQAKVQGQSG